MLGYARFEVLRRSIFDFVNPEDVAAARKEFDHLIANPGNERRVDTRPRASSLRSLATNRGYRQEIARG